jgi:hypothetical protein
MGSKAAQDLAARAARQASRRRAESPAAPAQADAPAAAPSVPPAAAAPRARPVRLTVDLAPVLHRDLTRWCADAADALGLAKVPAAAVVRALVQELDGNPDLAAAVRRRLVVDLER